MFSEHFYPCDRNEDRKSVQWNVFTLTPRNWRELEHPGDVFSLTLKIKFS